MTFLVLCRPYRMLLFLVDEKDIHTFLLLCRPYHTLLFLVDEKDILDSLSTDASPALRRLVRHSSPLKSFRTLGRGALNLTTVIEDSAKLNFSFEIFVVK
jgi:hypothetical protein